LQYNKAIVIALCSPRLSSTSTARQLGASSWWHPAHGIGNKQNLGIFAPRWKEWLEEHGHAQPNADELEREQAHILSAIPLFGMNSPVAHLAGNLRSCVCHCNGKD